MDSVYMVLQDDLDLTPTIRTPHAAYVDLTPFIHQQDLDRWYTLLAPLPPCHPEQGPWICGGAVRRFLQDLPLSTDIDYFFRNQTDYYQVRLACESQYQYPMIQNTIHHSTFKIQEYTVQLIQTKFHSRIFEHMDAFDFTICQTGWDGERFWMSQNAYHDIQSRTLQPTYSIDTLTGTWTRILKYAQREGYTPSSSLIEFCLQYAREHGVDTPSTYA